MGEIFLKDYILTGMEDFEGNSYNTLELLYEGTKIGSFSFYVVHGFDDDIMSVRPYLANIDPGFCHKGIGTELIRRVAKDYPVHFCNSNNNPVEDKDEIHYTDEGYGWMKKCLSIDNVSSDEETLDDYDF